MKKEGNSILKNTAIVGMLTTLSRVLGLVREMLQSRLIGAGWEQSAFALAFAIPNMARKLFGEGALTAAFIPIFKKELETEGIEEARRLARAVMSMALLMLGAIIILAVGGITISFSWFPWGMEEGSESCKRMQLILSLTRTLVPYMIFICAAAFGMGIMNAMGRFTAAAFLPSLLNVIWILSLVYLLFAGDMSFASRTYYVAIAILIAGATQMALMFWCMGKRGMSPRFTFKGWRDSKVCQIWKNTAIGAIGAGAIQINYMLDQLLAQWASPWAAAVVGYADRLMDMPLGIIGVAFGTVLLPAFSGYFAKDDVEGARMTFVATTQKMLFLILPAAAGLAILATDITRVIYEGRAFDSLATARVARAVACYAVGLGFFGLQKCLVPWFQAQKDMKTPLVVSVRMVFLNAFLNIISVLLLPVEWKHVGLAGSTVICSIISCVMLGVIARRRNGALGFNKLLKPIIKILFASFVMCVVILSLRLYLSKMLISFGIKDVLFNIVSLAILVIAGAITYFGLMVLMSKGGKVFKSYKT
jgi:putative peptidoglycan lipid II flippase